MDPGSLFRLMTNSTLLATRLFSNKVSNKLRFETYHYCAIVFEDAPISTSITKVTAYHSEGKPVLYNIVKGNKGGLFSVDRVTGEVTVAAILDHEVQSKHSLTVIVETIDGSQDETTLLVRVADVNDNVPRFQSNKLHLSVVEEEHAGLPRHLAKIAAIDPDWLDKNSLLYTLIGDGVDGYSIDNAYFTINPKSGDVFQLKSLDRDPPNGKSVWRLKVKVHDGQSDWVTTRIELGDQEENKKLSSKNNNLEEHSIKDGVPEDKADAVSKESNCDLVQSLTSHLEENQKDRLKHLLTKLRNKNGRVIYYPKVNVMEMEIYIEVKDINDNPPVFPNTTIHAQVQENGPMDLHVITVKAWDADDPNSSESLNLNYYLEKNAVDETSGTPIFKIDSQSGEIRTQMCCLDRETTFEYNLQVVATDGGGLKGTGTVAVRLSDVNDNTPKFARPEWQVVIDETPENKVDPSTLFEITVSDPDTSNSFLFRVVKSSGWGWEHFGIRTKGSTGEVFAIRPLDYEDKRQRDGFRFLVEVTDQGNWSDLRKVASAWIVVRLRDLNDNAPVFENSFIRVSIPENVPVNYLVARVKASDPDQDGEGSVTYSLLDDGSSDFVMNSEGEIRTYSTLDRESNSGARRTVRVLATDNGNKPLSSTATIDIHLTDVNDSPPRLVGNPVFHVPENVQPTKVGILLATDDDLWGLGHGPPFTFHLEEKNTKYVLQNFKLEFYQDLDSGRGGALLSTTGTLDRELEKEVSINISVSDAGNLKSYHQVSVIVDDVNDNDMFPASKTIYMWRVLGPRTNTTIGRVYVEDLDDWDSSDKVFEWLQEPQPLFNLDESTGEITTSALIRQGVYNMNFKVSDLFRGQFDVGANVTLIVKMVDSLALSHAIPVTVPNVEAFQLTNGWTPLGYDGVLGKLIKVMEYVCKDEFEKLIVVSIGKKNDTATNILLEAETSREIPLYILERANAERKKSSVLWIAGRSETGSYIPSFKLRGLLALKINKIIEETGTEIEFSNELSFSARNNSTKSEPSYELSPIALSSSSSRISSRNMFPTQDFSTSVVFPQNVVDSNRTSVITPQLTRKFRCPQENLTTQVSSKCSSTRCLNGGKCLPGSEKCICPGWTWGPQCKVLTRSFTTSSFSWFDPLPSCFPLTLSFFIRPKNSLGIILYSGPFYKTPSTQKYKSDPMSNSFLLLQIKYTEIILELRSYSEELVLSVVSTEDSQSLVEKWHFIEITVDEKGASLSMNHCPTLKYKENNKNQQLKCHDSKKWRKKAALEKYPWKVPWQISLPLQIGGSSFQPGYKKLGLVNHSFEGCVSKLRINNTLMDLGSPFLNQRSSIGCTNNNSSSSNHQQNLHNRLCRSEQCPPSHICSQMKNSSSQNSCFCSSFVSGSRVHCSSFSSSSSVGGEVISLSSSNTLLVPVNITQKQLLQSTDSQQRPSWIYDFEIQFRTTAKSISLIKLKFLKNLYLALKVEKERLCLEFGKVPKEYTKQKIDNYSFTKGLVANQTIVYNKIIPKNKIKLKIKELNNQLKIIKKSQSKTAESSEGISVPQNQSLCLKTNEISDGLWHTAFGGLFGNQILLELDDGEFNKRASRDIAQKLNFTSEDGNISLRLGGNENVPKNYNYIEKNATVACVRQISVMDIAIETKDKRKQTNQQPNKIVNKKQKTKVNNKQNRKKPNKEEMEVDSLCSSSSAGCPASHDICFRRSGDTFSSSDAPVAHQAISSSCNSFSSNNCSELFSCNLDSPCLNGGTCEPQTFSCACPRNYAGEFCQWEFMPQQNSSDFTKVLPLFILVVAFAVTILAAIGCFLRNYHNKRRRKSRRDSSSPANPEENASEERILEAELVEKRNIAPAANVPLMNADDRGRGGSLRRIPCTTRDFQHPSIASGSSSLKGLRRNLEERDISVACNNYPLLMLSQTINDSLSRTEQQFPLQEDLRGYSYEGDGSSVVSMGSALSGSFRYAQRK